MKKFITLAMCLLAVGSVSAQKQVVDQVGKMSGKIDKLPEARAMINEAMSNPETMNDARTYYMAGKIEFDAYDSALKKQMINPQDPDVKPLEMSQQIINGYNQFIKALPLDSIPNEKGQVKPRFSKDMINKINGYFNDYFTAGGLFYNSQMYYPQAYDAFMIYGEIPSLPFADKNVKAVPDSMINSAFFNAGISAYAGNETEASARAFKKARLNGTDNPQNYIYEIACWQYLQQKDSTKTEQAKNEIREIAEDGYKKFGMSQPLFINNIVNAMIMDGAMDKALALVTEEIGNNPDNAALYGLRGYVNDRMDRDDESVADYKKAAALPEVDIETLKNAVKKLYRVGAKKLEALDPKNAAEKAGIKTEYFEAAKNLSNVIKEKNPNDADMDYIIENIDYALETYFN